jgi:hypothetical protein
MVLTREFHVRDLVLRRVQGSKHRHKDKLVKKHYSELGPTETWWERKDQELVQLVPCKSQQNNKKIFRPCCTITSFSKFVVRVFGRTVPFTKNVVT